MTDKPIKSGPMTGGDYTARLKSWVERLSGGDESALDELLRSFQKRLVRLTHTMLRGFPRVRRWEDTDAVLNSSLVRLWRALKDLIGNGRIASDGTFRTHDLLRLGAKQIRRELLDLAKHYRHSVVVSVARGEDGSEMLEAGERSDGGTHDSHRLAEWTEFHKQIETLPDELREVFDLLWYHGLTQTEAAAILGVTDRTVKSRWQKARLKLHEILDGRIPGARLR